MTSLLTALISAFVIFAPTPVVQDSEFRYKEPGEVDFEQFDMEVTLDLFGPDGLGGFAFWYPPEYMALVGELPPIVQLYGEYSVFMIALSQSDAFGNVNPVSQDQLREVVSLRDAEGAVHAALDPPREFRAHAAMIRAMLEEVFGGLAEQMAFLYFPALDANGNRIADPVATSRFSLVVSDLDGTNSVDNEVRVPLPSLLEPKFCPVDGEELPGNFVFCPWHGERLEFESSSNVPVATRILLNEKDADAIGANPPASWLFDRALLVQ